EAITFFARGGGGRNSQDHPASTEVGREVDCLAALADLAAPVELERDEPRRLERSVLDHGRAGEDRELALTARGLVRGVEGAFELGLDYEAIARPGQRRIDEHRERRLRGRRACAPDEDRRERERERKQYRRASHRPSPLRRQEA